MKEEKSTKFNLNKLQNQWRVIMREGMVTTIIFSSFWAAQNPKSLIFSWIWLANYVCSNSLDFPIWTPSTDHSKISNFDNFSSFLLNLKTM